MDCRRRRRVSGRSAQFTLEQAGEKDQSLAVGDTYEEKIANLEFGRIAAQTAKQVIVQKVREAEREIIIGDYQDRVGELVAGTVKKVTRDSVIVDLGSNAEALLPRDQMIPRETFRMGDRLRALLTDVRSEQRGPQLFLSRTLPAMLIELFKIEVPEIAEEVIEIKAAARDPGSGQRLWSAPMMAVSIRLARALACADRACRWCRMNWPMSASISFSGMIIRHNWSSIPWRPQKVASIIVDEDSHTMDIAVEEDNLAQAIGRGGQNVRLSSELTGWTINVMSEEDAAAKQQQEAGTFIVMFMEKLDVDEDVAEVLVQEGFTSVEEVAYVPLDEILAIGGFDEEIANELRNRAKDALLTQAIASEEDLSSANIADDLLNMEGMDDALALQLAKKNILSMEDLAEQAVDELMDIEGMDEERAGELIMTARAPWFE